MLSWFLKVLVVSMAIVIGNWCLLCQECLNNKKHLVPLTNSYFNMCVKFEEDPSTSYLNGNKNPLPQGDTPCLQFAKDLLLFLMMKKTIMQMKELLWAGMLPRM